MDGADVSFEQFNMNASQPDCGFSPALALRLRRKAALLVCLLTVVSRLFETNAQTPEDVVTFFQHALDSPQDVQEFTADMSTLRERIPADLLKTMRRTGMSNSTPSIQHFWGARGGSNFLLKQINQSAPTITGRLAAKAFNVVASGISYGFEGFDPRNPTSSDRISQASESAFGLVSQFLQMGLGEIRPQSVFWTNNGFVGQNDLGRPEYGRLELSNGLPWKLSLSWTVGDPPFKVIYYEYPEPLWRLSGYPLKVTIWSSFEDGLHPFIQFKFSTIRLAQHALSSDYFDPGNFITANTKYTNIWSKHGFVGISAQGTATVSLANFDRSVERVWSSPWHFRVIYACFILLILFPLVMALLTRKRKEKLLNPK